MAPPRSSLAGHGQLRGREQEAKPMIRLCMRAATALYVLLFSVSSALAQPYPSRAITLIHSFQAGDIVDIFIRSLEPKISAELGQPLVVEYRPGAGGIIGTAAD